MKHIASFLVYDSRRHFCARQIDVIVPDGWDGQKVLDAAPQYLPDQVVPVEDHPDGVQFFDLDDDPVFADWTAEGVQRGQFALFSVPA